MCDVIQKRSQSASEALSPPMRYPAIAYHHALKPGRMPSSSRAINTAASPAMHRAPSRSTRLHARSPVSPPTTTQTMTARKPSNPDCFSDIAHPARTPLANNHHALRFAEQVRTRRSDSGSGDGAGQQFAVGDEALDARVRRCDGDQ